ncbi:serine acetyltransferase [Seonamhaeicola sp. MEBiC1930]|uniref:serine O-acetyltransferase n=1 Tax=Seonamhaeicola sp. MEBiC01930 TaxID=2976768 RepID=UPI003244D0C9
MIKSKKDFIYYLEADRIAKSRPKKEKISAKIKGILYPNIWEFQKTLRILEYYTNCKKGIISKVYRFFLKLKFKRLSSKLGFSIPINVFGPGLSIAHAGTIIINGGSRIGANCRLHTCVNIGTEAGYDDQAPIIGDNCYIGPGAKLFGKIVLADGIAVGANAVVNKTFNETNIAIGGVPAKKIANIDTFDYLIPATYIIERKINIHNELSGISAKDLKRLYPKKKINE